MAIPINIKIYGKKDCINCEEIVKKFTDKNIQFEYIIDMEKAIEIGGLNKIRSLPIVIIDEVVYDFNKAKTYLESV